jgi:hypothetical protein
MPGGKAISEILKFWIIQRDSGVCVFEQSFSESAMNLDSDLIGGFISAIMNFSDEVVHSKIEFVKLKDYLLFYDFSKEFIFVYLCSEDAQVRNIKKISDRVVATFAERFELNSEQGFTGDVTKYGDFAGEIETLLDTKSFYHKFLKEFNQQIKESYQSKYFELQKLLTSPISLGKEFKQNYQVISSKFYEKISETVNKFEDKLIDVGEKLLNVKKKIFKEESDKKAIEDKKE